MLERSEDKRYAVKSACLDSLVPEGHLLRKIEKAIDFEAIYPMVEHLYSEDNGRPAADPVVLVKMAFLQHLYGIRSLRRTRDDVEMNIAYGHPMHSGLALQQTRLSNLSGTSHGSARSAAPFLRGILSVSFRSTQKMGPAQSKIDCFGLAPWVVPLTLLV